MAMGRKVVVFHDYKQGGGFNPFDMSERAMGKSFRKRRYRSHQLGHQRVQDFKFKDPIGSDLFKASSAHCQLSEAVPGVLLGQWPGAGQDAARKRGQVPGRRQRAATDPGAVAGRERGHQPARHHRQASARAVQFGQPTQPTMAMQQEGRIYRMGQVTDAIIRYLNTGTNWERWASRRPLYSGPVRQKTSAAESWRAPQAMPSSAGSRKAGTTGLGSMEDEGKGGKARDAAANNVPSEYDRAKAFY